MIPHRERDPAQAISARPYNRLPVRLRREWARQRAGAGRAALPEAIEELTGPAPAAVQVPSPEEWDDAALLETYEIEDGDDEYNDEFDDADGIVEIVSPAHRGAAPDYSRFVAAMQAKADARGGSASSSGAIGQQAIPVAISREECRQCGIPGFKGCAHQAPFELLPTVELSMYEPNHNGAYRRNGR